MQRSWNDFGMSLSNVVAGAIFAGVMLECHLFFRGRCSINGEVGFFVAGTVLDEVFKARKIT